MADLNTSIRRRQLKPIRYDDFDATNLPSDNYVASYDLATGKFTWIANAGGVSQLSDLSDVGVTTPTDKNILIADGDSWESRALVEADISDLQIYLKNLVEDTTPQLGGNLDLNGNGIDFPSILNISDVKDEDDMVSNSDTMLSTQQSIKAFTLDKTKTTFGITIDGGGGVIETGYKGFIRIPYGCNITKITLLANESGSIVIDIWKDTYVNYPPTDADSITASAPPTLSGATKNEDSTLTGWTKTITAGDCIGFNVDSVTTITKVTLIIEITKI